MFNCIFDTIFNPIQDGGWGRGGQEGLDHYKVEVIITSLIEMLQLSNFSHMTTYTV